MYATKKYYDADPQPYKDRAALRRRNLKLEISKLKEAPCIDCGRQYPSYVMDFDHVRGQKIATINSLLRRGATALLREELKKCEIVCANCHRIRTHNRLRN